MANVLFLNLMGDINQLNNRLFNIRNLNAQHTGKMKEVHKV